MSVYFVTHPRHVALVLRAWSWLDRKVRSWARSRERLYPIDGYGRPDFSQTPRRGF